VSADGYRHRRRFPTRWNDNDQYGHVNNVVHYEAMDTTINHWLLADGGMDPLAGERAVCVASSCTYHRSVAYPDDLEVGLRAGRVGRTSITWELGIFDASSPDPAATGSFTHVFVDPATSRPVPVPERVRAAVERDLT